MLDLNKSLIDFLWIFSYLELKIVPPLEVALQFKSGKISKRKHPKGLHVFQSCFTEKSHMAGKRTNSISVKE